MRCALLFTPLFLASAALAQDPPVPPGGFPIKLQADNRITYSDGYQTALDIRYPDAAAPQTGWPCALIVHGGSGHRKRAWVVTVAELLTRNGYIALSYDTGGWGITRQVNSPWERADTLRIRDVAEIFYFAKQLLGARMDETRLAMKGKSGGAKHSLWGASYSGKPLPTPSALVTRMPKLTAIFTDIQVLDFVSDNIPNGNLIRAEWFMGYAVRYGASDPRTQLFLNKDFAGMRNLLLSEPGSGFFSLLRQSDVPIFVSYAYDDTKHFVNVNADAFPKLKPGVPTRFFLGTGGHGAQNNNIVGRVRRDLVHRWFDRFLKNENNGVDREPFAEVAILENDPTRYQNANTPWKHRHSRTWPIVGGRRLFLRSGGRLMSTAPSGIEAGDTLEHRVMPGYDEMDFAADQGSIQRVTQNIRPDAVGFQTPPLTEPQELLGRTIVELDVVSSGARDFQMSAALLDVPPTGSPRFITSGTAGLQQTVPGRHRLKIALGDVGYILRKGHRLRLQLENLNIKRQPGNAHFFCLPEFANYDLTVQIDPAFPPRVDLPMSPARASLMPRYHLVDGTNTFAHTIGYTGESSRAGHPYLMLLGASGAWPGFNAPPRVPLNVDAFTQIGLSVTNTPFLANFLGVLNAQGNAQATFMLPTPVAIATRGMRFTFVGSSVDGSGQHSVTNPIDLKIE